MVLLDVVVTAEGTPAEVRVVRSARRPPLDDAAVRTVQSRWRFVPATENGRPVSTQGVRLPIRVRLEDASQG